MVDNTRKVRLLSRAFGTGILSRDGLDINVQCPKCKRNGKKKKKLSVRLSDGVYHCWVCELKGKNIDYLFREYAPSHLDESRSIGFSRHETHHSNREDVTEINLEIQAPPGFVLLGSRSGIIDPDINDVFKYCRSRGLSLRDMWYFKLGTCRRGKFRRRVIFPSFDAEGHLNYYTARAIDNSKTIKYLNAKVPKKSVIFNEINIDWTKTLTLVEGPFDLTKTSGNVTCILGSYLSPESNLFRQIARSGTPINLALDFDARAKTHEIAKSLYQYGIDVQIVSVPSGRDIGDMTKIEYKQIIESAAPWRQSDRLLHLISNIRSGSIL